MTEKRYFNYDFWSFIILIFYAVMQISRWQLFPQHLDIYYHLLTAWGFVQAGGYPSWDFWECAPVGRPHIYPPLFHILLASFMKAGVDKILLAKIFSVVFPLTFLVTLWSFLRSKFSSCLAFFSLVAISSSLSFYASLTNHLPSTIALTFGILAIWQFMNGRAAFTLLLLLMCFYTHIGASYFVSITIAVYALFNKESRRTALVALIGAFVLAAPMIMRQLSGVNLLSVPSVKENFSIEFKTIDYIMAIIGIAILLRSKGKGRLFLAFFIASFVYLPYLARFFSAEGYLAVALLAAVAFYGMCESIGRNRYAKYAVIAAAVFMLTLSPTIVTGQLDVEAPRDKIFFFDSAPMNLLFPQANQRMISGSIWYKKHYEFASKLIRENSAPDEIIYCFDNIVGVCLAAVSGRATANHLLPEVYPRGDGDPYKDSRIIIMLKYQDPKIVKEIANRYGLVLLGENEILYIYNNSAAKAKIKT